MKNSGLYIQLFSVHGLIRYQKPELGRDADTGGQVKYVLELAKCLGEHPAVAQVDLVTRLIVDKRVSNDYAEDIEPISDKVRLVRIACGPRKYIRKELLWPHLDEFIDKTIKFLKFQEKSPDIFHGHYADGGYVAMSLAETFGAPFVFTGHSLGRNKKTNLLADGMQDEQINSQYKMKKRIEVEEEIINNAKLIITSTNQEIEKQYGLYNNFSKNIYKVIPPGIDLDVFFPYYNYQLDPDSIPESSKQAKTALRQELHRFWLTSNKPFILALCRPDHRKNIAGLIKAYGKDKELQIMANLAVFAGIRNNIKSMEENERNVLTNMLLQMDQYDLYGKLAIPKQHDFSSEVPELYRLCAESGGVFINPALVEPFGITLIEASACGLPIVATNDGGPVDIIANCHNGILINPNNSKDISTALKSILVDRQKWKKFSANGVNGVSKHYSWKAHCEQTIKNFITLLPRKEQISQTTTKGKTKKPAYGQRLTSVNKLLITDIDNTLAGNPASLKRLLKLLEKNEDKIAWGVATGRSLEMTLDIMTEQDIPIPDVMICSVGTEIYYGANIRIDRGWQQHLSKNWKPEQIHATLDHLDFISLQDPESQRYYKISYYMKDDQELLAMIYNELHKARLPCEVIFSHGQFLDILPFRASKGKAIKYLKYKWEISPNDVMVAGDSGNDEDMLRGRSCALVVGNHSNELNHLKGRPRVHFSQEKYAAGIIDGLKHYGFL